MIIASYTCETCDTEGTDRELAPGAVLCWNCGEQATVTARISIP